MEPPHLKDGPPEGVVAAKRPDVEGPSGEVERVLGARADICAAAAADPVIQGDNPGWNSTATSVPIVAFPVIASPDVRRHLVRERTNAAARPILESFAWCRGIPLERLREAIDGPTPLTHPEIVRRLAGALNSKAMRSVIASNADLALLPLKVRIGISKMMAQDLSEPPPVAARGSFPDWSKPIAPRGHQLQTWRPEDAAAWLERFPPNEDLLHPIDIWDGDTAARWLNDREAIPPALPWEDELAGKVLKFELQDPWKPSLEVLHTLYELELEELTYRVFVERLRREVMPYYVSERIIHVWKAVELITFGYQTLQEARRSVRTHDLRRIEYFNQVFGENHEWIYDLCCRIVAAYVWPVGFAEPELSSEFPDL